MSEYLERLTKIPIESFQDDKNDIGILFENGTKLIVYNEYKVSGSFNDIENETIVKIIEK